MKFQRSRTFAEHKLIQRVARALCALLLLPLAGIVVGAVFWWNLERGLLLFNLLGVGLFAAITYPFWRGERQKKRRLQLLFSGYILNSSYLLLFPLTEIIVVLGIRLLTLLYLDGKRLKEDNDMII